MEQKRRFVQQQDKGGKAKRGRKDVADTILYGGDIITMDDHNTKTGVKVEAIAITDGIITQIGSLETVFSLKGPQTEVIFLNQQTLMPGFIEPHQHAGMTSQMKCMFTNIGGVGDYRCYADICKAMKTTIQKVLDDDQIEDKDKWALFIAWDPELISDLPTLSATFLDENFSKEVAIVVVGQSGHTAWVNNLALTRSDIENSTAVNPVGGTFVRDEDGNLTGQLLEEPAIGAVIENARPRPSGKVIIESVDQQWKYYASVGLTTVTDLAYMPSKDFDEILKTMARSDDCPIRLGLYQLIHPSKDDVYAVATPPAAVSRKSKPAKQIASCCPRFDHIIGGKLSRQQKVRASAKRAAKTTTSDGGGEEEEGEPIGYVNDKLWRVGYKIVADGSPHCGSGAVREPYLNTPLTVSLGFPKAPNYGILNFTTDDYLATIKKLTKEGKQAAIHCHGERACEQILKVYEQVLADDPSNTCRHRMEHIGLMTVDQIARAGKINVALSFFVDHLRFYASVYKTDIFGEERVNRWTPLSEATKNGVTWTIHQDHPTFPGDASPFANMKTAITRTHRDDPTHVYGPEYRVSIHEALKAYTVNAAWQLHLDDQLGSITVGKKADLVVLSENPYHKDPFQLEDIKVVETFLGGRRNNVAELTTIAGVQDKVLQLGD